MKQELIKELNKRIIVDFEQAVKELNTRIETFKETCNNGSLDGETLADLEEVIAKMEDAKKKLEYRINYFKKQDNKGISAFYSSDGRHRTVSEDTNYADKFNAANSKYEKSNKDIERLNANIGIINGLNSKSKLINIIKKSLENRVKALEKKNGTIKNRQSKIVDKATKDKLSRYLEEIKKSDRIAGIVANNNNRINELDEKKGNLMTDKQQLNQMKSNLLASKNLLEKGVGVMTIFDEKLTDVKIKGLQAKQGIVKFANKQVVKQGVKPSVIAKMKDKVKIFNATVKSGVEAFKNSYQSNIPTIVPSPTR